MGEIRDIKLKKKSRKFNKKERKKKKIIIINKLCGDLDQYFSTNKPKRSTYYNTI